jgi:putative ABC transport system permease protein
METLWQDIRFGIRMLLKSPGFAAIAVLTLGLGVGANTAIFSVVDAVLLRPLPFPEPNRLLAVWGNNTERGETRSSTCFPDFFDFRAQNRVFERMAAFYTNSVTLTGRGDAQHLQSGVVSPDLFPLLGVAPKLGRTFLPEEEKPVAEQPIILSEALWKSRFGGDPSILGQTVVIDGKESRIVGVMPASFQFPIQNDPVQLWQSTETDATTTDGTPPPYAQRGMHYLKVIARLKPNVTPAQAQANMSAIADGLARQYPDTDAHRGVMIVTELDRLVGQTRPALLLLLAAVGCVLLIACANVANLLLARATTRQREMSVRAALGAGRRRIARQLLTESMLLSMAGGAVGLILAVWGTGFLTRLSPNDIPRVSEAGVDGRVLGFTLLVSLITGLVFGLAPVLHLSRADLAESLKEGGRSSTSAARHNRLRGLLVVSEVTLALVLLIGSGLLIQSLFRLQKVNLGFDPHGVLALNLDLPGERYSKPQQAADFVAQLLDRIRALPGVRSASSVVPLPLSGDQLRFSFAIEGRPVPKSDQPVTEFHDVGIDYFRTMRIPLVSGREFTALDKLDSAQVTIINQTFARKFFPGENPIGKHIKPGIGIDVRGSLMREIVGVVGDAKLLSLRDQPLPECYVPHAQVPFPYVTLAVRSSGDPEGLAPAIRQLLASMDKDLPLYGVRTLDQYVAASVAQPRFSALLLGVFAGVALILTVVGLYGVMSYSVAQRTHEIGVRVALGAQEKDVLRLVLQQGLKLTLAGVSFGIVAAWAATRLMATQLFGVSPTDPPTFLTLAILLSCVGLLAGYIPARRAMRVDPMVALRYE